jgi:polar amino acid transport system substrate-binding protein
MENISNIKKCVVLSVLSSLGMASTALASIQFGMSADYPPMAFYKEGKLKGLEIKLAKSITEELKQEAVLKDTKFDLLPNLLESGDIDAIIASFSVTPERKEKFDFTTPYYREEMAFLYKKSNPLTQKEQLLGKKIAYPQSESIQSYLGENISSAKLIPTDNLNEALKLLKTKNADCVCVDKFVAEAYRSRNSKLDYFEWDPLKASEGIAIAVKKDSPLKEGINNALKALEDNGKLQELKRKFGLNEN